MPSWDYFEYVISPLEKNYHLIIPAITGYEGRMPCAIAIIDKD